MELLLIISSFRRILNEDMTFKRRGGGGSYSCKTEGDKG